MVVLSAECIAGVVSGYRQLTASFVAISANGAASVRLYDVSDQDFRLALIVIQRLLTLRQYLDTGR